MIARGKFSRGQRVRLSAEGQRSGIAPRSARAGTVVGFGRAPNAHVVWIVRDGCKASEAYHMDFWEGEPEMAHQADPVEHP